jgi:hypothetical protein
MLFSLLTRHACDLWACVGAVRSAAYTNVTGISATESVKGVGNLPYRYDSNLLGLVQTFGSALFPIALTLQLPVYVYVAVMEKELKLRCGWVRATCACVFAVQSVGVCTWALSCT